MTFERAQTTRSSHKLAAELGRRIGEHKVILDRDVLEGFGGDESHHPPVIPDALVRARSAEDVAATLELAERFCVPITPRGGGTGKAGGAIPIFGGVVLDTTRMNRIVEINNADLVALVEPGAILGDFQQAVEAEGLFYPPDPNSLETCTIAGNAAHNAGGPRAFKYGVTRQYVMGVDMALIGGTVIESGRRTIKCAAGYDLAQLAVGSEGTLGVFTRLRLRLIHAPPHVMTLLARFKNEADASRAVLEVVKAGIVPRVMEFLDPVAVDTLRRTGAGSVPEDTQALVIAELDGLDEGAIESDAVRFAELCEKAGSDDVLAARHVGERNELWAARRELSNALKSLKRHKISEDIAVPRSAAPRFLESLKEIGRRRGVTVASYGHAGDGNYHVNILWDDDDLDVQPAVSDVFRSTLDCGGTITGEHGVGLTKKSYLPWQKSAAELNLARALKAVFDPRGLCNPGKIFS